MKKNIETTKWLFEKGKKFIPAIVVLAIANIISAYLGVRYALVTKDMIDAATGASDKTFASTLVVMVVYLLVTLLISLFIRNLARTTAFNMNWFWKEMLMNDVIYADYQSVNKYHSGNLLSRMSSDVIAVDDGMVSFFPGILAMLTRLITAIIIMGQLEPTLTLVVCVGGVLVFLGSTFLRTKLKSYHKEVQEANAKLTSFIQEVLERIFMVQALDVGEEIEKRERVYLKDRLAIQIKRKNLGLLTSGGLRVVMIIAEFAILAFCVLKLRAGLITFGTMTAMIQLFGKLESPFVSMSGILPKYIAMIGSAERIREVTDITRDYPDAVDAQAVYGAMSGISGKGVWFRYDDAPEGEFVIKDLSFEIPKGKFCAITGDSGIGKSTLLKLMLGVCRPSEGEMRIITAGSYNLSGESAAGGSAGGSGSSGGSVVDNDYITVTKETRSLFAYVPQGNILMSGTLRENLLLTSPEASEEELAQAMEVADMRTFAQELPQGLDTKLGENALGISEGQAQRVSIARAVLSGKPIILLDEATSSLDAATEERVLARLRQLPGKTIIAVTHRPAARELADCVIEF